MTHATNTLSIDDILRGTELGRSQSVGHMQVVPLIGPDNGDFAPPQLEVSTTAYGTVVLRNRDTRPTIVPPGASWLVKQSAQDHALGGGALLAANSELTIHTARCIQSSQCGMIKAGQHPMLVLPAPLRPAALAQRKQVGCGLMWDAITAFNREHGVRAVSHLEYFLRQFQHELARFVAQFELVPRQLGAVVLVGGQVVGVERAPSTEFWRAMWEPLIRVCYGSLAIAEARKCGAPAATRVPLQGGARTLAELRAQLHAAEAEEQRQVHAKLDELRGLDLRIADQPDQALGTDELRTLASEALAGQIVQDPHRGVLRFASLTYTGTERAAARRCEDPSHGTRPAGLSDPTTGSVQAAHGPSTDGLERPSPDSNSDSNQSVGRRLRRWLFGV